MAARHLSCLAAELDEYGQGVREAAKQLEGKTDVCRLASTAGTSMFEASVGLAEGILFAVTQSLVVAMRVMNSTGPELKRAPVWDDVRDHWPAIRKTLRDFPEFDLDIAQKTLRVEAKRHLRCSKSKSTVRGLDRTKEELFKAALRTHHKYDSDDFNNQAASNREIERLSEGAVSDSTARRYLETQFGSVDAYKRACTDGSIRAKLVVIMGDFLKSTDPKILKNLTRNSDDDGS